MRVWMDAAKVADFSEINNWYYEAQAQSRAG